MKKYKIIIKKTERFWEFEGPEGQFVIDRSQLDLHNVHLQRLLELCGFIVEWHKDMVHSE